MTNDAGLDALLFRMLTAEEEREFRAWAREHYEAGTYIKPFWHPVVRDECQRISAHLSQRRDGDMRA